MKTLVFKPTDTWFFRESRPMEANNELQSVFPPPVRTLAGAVRSVIGEQMGVKWHLFKEKSTDSTCQKLRQVIGIGDDLGLLSLQGAWLMYQSERLYPTPLHLMEKDNAFIQLKLDIETTHCDLGEHVRLTRLADKDRGAASLENTWLPQAAMQNLLNGEPPQTDQLKRTKDLFVQESRLGIANHYQTRAVKKGALYQTRHIRPNSNTAVALDVKGLPTDFPTQTIIRLGAEGRTASVECQPKPTSNLEQPPIKGRKFALYLLTPLYRENTPANQPLPGFAQQTADNLTYWQGEINGVSLKLLGAVSGKMQREGGWDMAKHEPREVVNLTPAGSVFFCELAEGVNVDDLKKLHLAQHGAMTDYGYGQFAVGIWQDERM